MTPHTKRKEELLLLGFNDNNIHTHILQFALSVQNLIKPNLPKYNMTLHINPPPQITILNFQENIFTEHARFCAQL
jgi:hypothetical protein